VTQAINKPNQKIINLLNTNNDIIDQDTFDEIIKVLSAFDTWQKSYLQDFERKFQESAEQFKTANNPKQQAHIKYSPSSIESADYDDKTLGGIKLFQQLGAKNIFKIEALQCSEVGGENKYFAGDENTRRITANLQRMLILQTQQYISKHNIDVNLTHYQPFQEAANNPNHFLHKTIKLIKIYEKDASNFKVAAKEAFPALHADTQIAKIKRLLDELQRKGQLHDWYKEPTIFEIICNFFAQIFCKNDKELGFVPTVKKSKEGLQKDLLSI